MTCCVLWLLFASQATAQDSESKLPTVNVRSGIHSEFDRIAFDWDKSVKYSVENKDGTVRIIFDNNAQSSVSKNFYYNISRISNFSTQSTDAGLVVSFGTDKNAAISVFRNGNTIVADIKGKAIAITAKEASAPETKAPEPKKVEEKKEKVKPETTEDKVIEALVQESVKEAKPETAEAKEAVTETMTQDSAKNETPVSGNAWKTGPEKIASIDKKIFANVAVFQRAGKGFIIFDTKSTLAQSEIIKDASTNIEFNPLDITHGSGFYFNLPEKTRVLAETNQDAVNIFIADEGYQANSSNTEMILEPEFALGPRQVLRLSQKAEPVTFKDVTIGDQLIVVPVAEQVAFGTEQTMVDFRILPSAQGLVVNPRNDSLIVEAIEEGIEITAPYGLKMSPSADILSMTDRLPSSPLVGTEQNSIFDINRWRMSGSFIETRQRLTENIAVAVGVDKNKARLELARFYFAYGFGIEALAMLQIIEANDADGVNHSDFIALKAAATILADKSDQGLALIEKTGLADQPELLLWKAVALAQKGEMLIAYPIFLQRANILTAYPDPFLSKFLILAIESALAANNLKFANELMGVAHAKFADNEDSYSKSVITPIIEPALNFFKGTIAAKKGNAADAKKFWELAKNSDNQLYNVRAELALIELAALEKVMTAGQAANRLESLRFAWRGDDLELEILERLGQFHLESGNTKLAMSSFLKAKELFPNTPNAKDIENKMAAVFKETYLGEAGKTLTPLEALALYRQYRYLMPDGETGTDILLSLADKLIAVDLLDQAAELLTELVKEKLAGEEKEQYILKLAGIQILNHKPNEALTALDMLGKIDEGKESLLKEANLLRSRALYEKKQYFDAKKLLENNYDKEARLLLADIANKEADWETAGTILLALLADVPKNEPLSSENKKLVLSAATAFALANDGPNLYSLLRDYGELMAKEPENKVFLLLTSASGSSSEDIISARKQLLQVDLFQDILNNYKNTFKE